MRILRILSRMTRYRAACQGSANMRVAPYAPVAPEPGKEDVVGHLAPPATVRDPRRAMPSRKPNGEVGARECRQGAACKPARSRPSARNRHQRPPRPRAPSPRRGPEWMGAWFPGRDGAVIDLCRRLNLVLEPTGAPSLPATIEGKINLARAERP